MLRHSIIKLHLCLAFLFLPFVLLMPLTGALHLVGVDGEQTKVEAFRSSDVVPSEVAQREDFFRAQFKKQNLDFDFELIRGNGPDFTFRPSSRIHYMASQTPEGLVFYRLEPDLLKRIFEIHKGHGPQRMKWLEAAFGLALILLAISGLWLAVTVTAYRKVALFSLGIGVILCWLCL